MKEGMMSKQGEICVILKDCVVTYDDSTKIRDAVFDKLIEWYFEHESFSGEDTIQRDGPSIDAPNILASIVDNIIKFDVAWIK